MDDPSEGLKRLIYERILHFSHLFEQSMEVELGEFIDQARLRGLASYPNNLTDIHVLDCIGKHEPINNTAIADKMNLSKASITKISAKLLGDKYIKRGRMNDNKKEVYFSLTPSGRRLFEVHEAMHAMIESRYLSLFDSFSASELQTILKFYQRMIDRLDGEPNGNSATDGG